MNTGAMSDWTPSDESVPDEAGSPDDERLIVPETDDTLPDQLDVDAETPVPDAIDQRRTVGIDDEDEADDR